MAHAERIAEGSDAVPAVTYDMIDTALEHVVRVANFLSANFFNDTVFGSIVPVPQYNVLEALDQPWVRTENFSGQPVRMNVESGRRAAPQLPITGHAQAV